jgi:hypothetical protein
MADPCSQDMCLLMFQDMKNRAKAHLFSTKQKIARMKNKRNKKKKQRRIINPSEKQLKQWKDFGNKVAKAKEIFAKNGVRTSKAWQSAMKEACKEDAIVLTDEQINSVVEDME